MVLLIDDDAERVSALKRLLAGEGRHVQVASTVEQAVAAFAHGPELILLAPSIASGRGPFILEERAALPKARSVPVVLLGEGVAGFDHPVAHEPFGQALLEQVRALAPPPSVELLAGAERALFKARTDAAAQREAAKQSSEALAAKLAAANAQLVEERAAAKAQAAALHQLEQQLAARGHELTRAQDTLAAVAREHAAEGSSHEALKAGLEAAVAAGVAQLEAEKEAHGVTEAKRLQLDEQLAKAEAELAAARAELEAVEAARRAELSGTSQKLEGELTRARRQLETARQAHRVELARLEEKHAEDTAAASASSDARVAQLQVQLDGARAANQLELDAARAEHDAKLFEAADEHRRALEASTREHEQRLFETRSELQRAREAHRRELESAVKPLEQRLRDAREALEAARAEHRAGLEETETAHGIELEALRTQLLGEAQAAREQLEAQLSTLAADRDAERALAAKALQAERSAAEAARAEHHAERARANAEAADGQELASELERVKLELQAVRDQLGAAQATLTTERERTAAAEARALAAQEQLRALENRTHLVATVEDEAKPLQIPRTGSVSMGELARLAMQLWAARADVRVDLGVEGGTRRLWLRRGALVAAWSSLPTENLSVRARRDGLIDARQEQQLREVRDASPASLLEELRQRGLVRRGEVDGLVQRWVEEIALEALSEAVCTYRLYDEAPGAEVPAIEPKRTLPSIAAQALRRSLPFEVQLELLGGTQVVPKRQKASLLDLETLGFAENERALLDDIDGETSVESLLAGSGLRPERGYQVLTVAKIAGVISVGPPLDRPHDAPPADPDSLDAMFEQVQQADYFGILGLPRSAGAADVKAARERLAKQFDPLRWSTHPDRTLLERAKSVLASIEEAAKTLQDDHLRAAYARHLE